MKTKTISYGVATGLTAFAVLWSSWLDLSRSPAVLEGMAHLGYPPYLPAILGVWKVLGAVAILAPKFPRLKEWAYAGVLFDLTGASISHAASGDSAGMVITPLVILGIAAASWALRPDSRKLAAPASAADDDSALAAMAHHGPPLRTGHSRSARG